MRLLVLIVTFLLTHSVSGQIICTFNSDAQGWTTSTDAQRNPVPDYVSTGGNDGGYIQAVDGSQGSYFYFVAPSAYHGNLSDYIGDTLYFDIKINVTGESDATKSDVTISGNGMTLVTNLFTAGPANQWVRRSVPLTANGGWRITTVSGSIPTTEEFLGVLSNVTDLRIKGEYTTSLETTGLDNVIVGSILALPVELASFHANSFADGVKLTWSTQTELNNYGFEIERRSQESGVRSQKNSWEMIGFVAGKGTTSDPQSYFFVDEKVSGTVSYRLKQVDFDGAFEYSNEVEFVGTPGKFEVLGNYPNPFNPNTVIRYQLSENSLVNISVYNILGQKVAELVNEKQLAGAQSVEFNAVGFASGLYIYKVKAGSNTVTRTMMLTK